MRGIRSRNLLVLAVVAALLMAMVMITAISQQNFCSRKPDHWRCQPVPSATIVVPPSATTVPTAAPTPSPTPVSTLTPTLAPSPTVAPTSPPPSLTPPLGVYGPAIAADGKDNRWIGMNLSGATPREVAHRWYSTGGQMTAYAYNQRTGTGYSMGDGGTVELSLYRCDPLPVGSPLATITHRPGNPGGEVKTPIPWTVTVPPGLVCITHRNIAPVGNFISANELWHPNPDSPRQPAFPDDSLAVLSKGEFSSGWSLVRQNTPVFDVTFADGHHEGQAYHERFVAPQEIVTAPADRVRERFTPTRVIDVDAVWFRVNRRSGSTLTVTLAGQTCTTSISEVPVETQFNSAVWIGGKWVRCPLNVTLPAGVEQSAVFNTNGSIRVAPIRETYGQSNPFWGSRQFRDGLAEKSIAGGAWTDMYFGVADLQMYFETNG